jgi:allophanate hydrolase
LIDAGAVPIGKTNLDQFATGLVGVRSPHGPCLGAFDERYVSGGSSSGSALAVAHGLVSFSLGTDTAGSGRVPAAFNNLVGLKPTRGLVSTAGVVPACRSLDCVSVFTGSVPDAAAVLEVLAVLDPGDPFSRERPPAPAGGVTRVGVPDSLDFPENAGYERLYQESVARLSSLGVRTVGFSLEPFLAAARLLYGGAWVAERYAAVGAFIEAHPDDVDPVVRDIVLGARGLSGADAFEATYRLAELRRDTEATWREVDLLLLPTVPTHPTLADVLARPVEENSRLGRYTNFMNLLDLAGIAVPQGFTAEGLPFGVTLVGPAFSEALLLSFADRLHRAASPTFGATGRPIRPDPLPARGSADDEILLAVAGAHLLGQPLNGELTSRGARLVKTTRTAPGYRLIALSGTVPPKPGLVRAPERIHECSQET